MSDNANRVEFTREMKKDYTIITPNMAPIHFELIKNVLESFGFHIELLRTTGREIVDEGLKYVHNDTCYPALLSIGQLMHALHSGKYDLHKVALIMTQTGGGCRASNYIHLLRKALKKDGLSIDVFSDSSYLMECFRKKWYLSWRKNGWKTAKKTPVENQELWRRLLELTEKHDIRFYRVKGHVNPDSPNAGLNGLYRKFTEWNGKQFSMDDFIYITRMNNRADELANEGMAPYKPKI